MKAVKKKIDTKQKKILQRLQKLTRKFALYKFGIK